jgi:hypothetical protein
MMRQSACAIDARSSPLAIPKYFNHRGSQQVDVFLVSYYAKGGAGYRRFADHMATQDALRLHRTLWVMKGPTKSWLSGTPSAASLRDKLKAHAGEHDTIAVFEVVDGLDWATHNALPGAVRRLKKRVGGGDHQATMAPAAAGKAPETA